MSRPDDAAAVAYVVEHFATRDYGMLPLCREVTVSQHGEECTDVHFVDANVDDDTRFTMTVWFQPDGSLYGEW